MMTHDQLQAVADEIFARTDLTEAEQIAAIRDISVADELADTLAKIKNGTAIVEPAWMGAAAVEAIAWRQANPDAGAPVYP